MLLIVSDEAMFGLADLGGYSASFCSIACRLFKTVSGACVEPSLARIQHRLGSAWYLFPMIEQDAVSPMHQ